VGFLWVTFGVPVGGCGGGDWFEDSNGVVMEGVFLLSCDGVKVERNSWL